MTWLDERILGRRSRGPALVRVADGRALLESVLWHALLQPAPTEAGRLTETSVCCRQVTIQ
jgi:hypothetical protein